MGKLVQVGIWNSKGVTLVEILAALALLSLVITLSISILADGKNTVERQNLKADMQDSVTLAMKDITKQVRSVAAKDISQNNNVVKVGVHTYRFSENKIFKDNLLLAENIGVLTFSIKENLVTIKIESIDNDISLFSEIHIRE